MKKLIAIIAVLLLPFAVFSQHLTNDTISNVERMLNLKGVVLKKELGSIIRSKEGTTRLPGSCNYRTLIITDLESGEKIGGLRVMSKYSYSIGSSIQYNTYYAYLDLNEVLDCVNFLKMLPEKYIGTSPEKYTELVYKTIDGFSIGIFYEQLLKNPDWKLFIKTKDYTDNSTVYIDKDDISVLISDFEEAAKSIKAAIGQ